MTLKTAYFDGSNGVLQKAQEAFDAGLALVGTQPGEGEYNTIQNGLEANAALGNTSFVVSVVTSYNPIALRNNKGDNLILKAYMSGVSAGLAASGIFAHECSLKLNTMETETTKIDMHFTF